MQEINYTVTAPLGLHIRVAGCLVKETTAFPGCRVILQKNGCNADARRLFAVLGLGVKQYDTFTILLEGEREVEAHAAFLRFCKKYLSDLQME